MLDKAIETSDGATAFDPSTLRLPQGFTEMVSVKKHILNVAIRKPQKQDFIRVHPDSNYRMEVAVIEDGDENITYVVHPDICAEVIKDVVPKVFLLTIDRQGVIFLWPIRLPDAEGKLDTWNMSAHDAAKMAETAWVRVVSNKSARAYEVHEAKAVFAEPEWPDLTFGEILKIALKGRLIDSLYVSI